MEEFDVLLTAISRVRVKWGYIAHLILIGPTNFFG